MHAEEVIAQPVHFLDGEKVFLRPLEKSDLPLIRSWANDPEMRALTGEVLPMSEAGAEEFYQRVQADQQRVWFVIVVKETGRVIGEAGLLRIFSAWRTADLSIMIGERGYRQQGFGREALELLLEYAFGYLNLHRVAIGVVSFNQPALRFYQKAGFKPEGVQRDGYYFQHDYHDFMMLSILEDEYRRLKPAPSAPAQT